ncbi:gastrula zinc finger protein XlCGF52.1 [Anabrus simplex]|uniref:gastrula zinc finger protein XlCGF52.1 n=1 Tax=Anabrus simplex TaxID=316456 RepID=UPI0034DD42D9
MDEIAGIKLEPVCLEECADPLILTGHCIETAVTNIKFEPECMEECSDPLEERSDDALDVITFETDIKPDPEDNDFELEMYQKAIADTEESSSSEVHSVEPEFCGIKIEPGIEDLYREELDSVKSPEQQHEEIDLVSDEDDEVLILSTSSYSHKNIQKEGARHKKKNSEKKTYSCATCNQKFTKRSKFTNHILIHILEKPFECTGGHEVMSQEAPDGNMVLNRKFLPCFECFKTNHLRWGQQKHKTLPTVGEKPYECFTCRASFSKFSELKEHAACHKDNSSYTCNECSQSFSRKDLLEKHISDHMKRYTCIVCKKRFKTRNHFQRHLKIHSD